MKRRKLIRHLEGHDCSFLREGAAHTIYVNVVNNLQSAVPRYREIEPVLVRKICKELDIPVPRER
jgi:hypothetical protein